MLFPDDAIFLSSGMSLECALADLAAILESVKLWFLCNRLKINEKKTQKICLFTGWGSVKLLEFIVYIELVWRDHTNLVCSKLTRTPPIWAQRLGSQALPVTSQDKGGVIEE